MISLSGMAHIFAFQNHKHVLLKEHTSFLKHEKLGVLESLFFSHSGKAKKDGFQNQKRSANDIFKPFRNTQKNGHSRTPNSNHIPEGLEKRLFRTNFLPNVLKGMIMGVFRNVMLLSIPEWGSRSPSGNAGIFRRNTRNAAPLKFQRSAANGNRNPSSAERLFPFLALLRLSRVFIPSAFLSW